MCSVRRMTEITRAVQPTLLRAHPPSSPPVSVSAALALSLGHGLHTVLFRNSKNSGGNVGIHTVYSVNGNGLLWVGRHSPPVCSEHTTANVCPEWRRLEYVTDIWGVAVEIVCTWIIYDSVLDHSIPVTQVHTHPYVPDRIATSRFIQNSTQPTPNQI